MILHEPQLKKLLTEPLRAPVYYYYSTEEYLVANYAAKTLTLLSQEQDAEVTRLEGPCPDIGEAVAAAGMISMFGTKRLVYFSLVDAAAMREEDVAALCDLCASLENAALVLTSVFSAEKLKDGGKRLAKKEKALIAAAEKNGVAAELLKPQAQDAKRYATEEANRHQTTLSAQAASALLERCGSDYFLLENEIAKLAAASGYTEITPQLISAMGTQNIEADVFEMVRMVSARQLPRALDKLHQLFELQNEPIAIAAALTGSFVDMYRVKAGAAAREPYGAVHKAFGYKGSDYRLKKSAETASGYTKAQLHAILCVLQELDEKLKSSAAAPTVLMETALCEIASAGKRV